MMGLTNIGMWDLHRDEKHLAQILKEKGYVTGLAGVYHETLGNPADRFGFELTETSVREGEKVASRTIEILERFSRDNRPFFLEVGFFEPHRARSETETDYMRFIGSYIDPDEEMGVTVPDYLKNTAQGREELAELQGAVRYMDRQVGRIMDSLRELNLEESTIVIFTTDHGVALPRAKCSLYDPGLEIALIVRWPEKGWSGGKKAKGLVSNVDIVPTLLAALDMQIPRDMQGVSFLSQLEGEADRGRECIFGEMTYHDYYDPRRCIRTDRYKLIVNFSGAPYFMNPSQSWRPRTDPVVPEKPALRYHSLVELYDLSTDPMESIDLANDKRYDAEKKDLLRRLHEWMKQTGDPILKGAVTSPHHDIVLGLLE
jgi:arylsulfatase A-like enzyme